MICFRKLGEYGRLGNQMFQIAATIGIAVANGMEYGFNKWQYQNRFIKPLPTISLQEEMIPLHEHNFSYSSYEISPDLDYELIGYFQSEKYWEDSVDHVLSYFALNSRTPYITIPDIVSVHVRRGDYLTKSNYHTNLSLNYYKKAMDMFPGCGFLVFSDDVAWCERNMAGPGISIMKGTDPIESMKLMSECTHNIIANSSFSWWGAYLNKNPDKKVIAPKQWFGEDGPKNTRDLIPKSWVVI